MNIVQCLKIFNLPHPEGACYGISGMAIMATLNKSIEKHKLMTALIEKHTKTTLRPALSACKTKYLQMVRKLNSEINNDANLANDLNDLEKSCPTITAELKESLPKIAKKRRWSNQRLALEYQQRRYTFLYQFHLQLMIDLNLSIDNGWSQDELLLLKLEAFLIGIHIVQNTNKIPFLFPNNKPVYQQSLLHAMDLIGYKSLAHKGGVVCVDQEIISFDFSRFKAFLISFQEQVVMQADAATAIVVQLGSYDHALNITYISRIKKWQICNNLQILDFEDNNLFPLWDVLSNNNFAILNTDFYCLKIKSSECEKLIKQWQCDTLLLMMSTAYCNDIHKKDAGNFTLLMHASRKGLTHLTKTLLAMGSDVDAQSNQGSTALTIATQNGHVSIVKLLLAQQAKVNLQTKHGSTALTFAAEQGHYEIIRLLLSHHADPNLVTGHGRSALLYCVEKDFLKAARLLLKHGADPNLTSNTQTLLMISAGKGHFQLVKLLVKHHVEINTVNVQGFSALHYASVNSHFKISQYLIHHGAHIQQNIRDRARDDPLLANFLQKMALKQSRNNSISYYGHLQHGTLFPHAAHSEWYPLARKTIR